MLTVSRVSGSGPGLLTGTIFLSIVVETGRRFGGGSVYTSTGWGSTPIAGIILICELLERVKKCKEMMWQAIRIQLLLCFCICRCYRLVVIRAWTRFDQRWYGWSRRMKNRRYFPFERLSRFMHAIVLRWSFVWHDILKSRESVGEVAVRHRALSVGCSHIKKMTSPTWMWF